MVRYKQQWSGQGRESRNVVHRLPTISLNCSSVLSKVHDQAYKCRLPRISGSQFSFILEIKMRIPIIFVLLSFFLASCFAINGNNARNLILTEQELRFAGSSLRTVLASNSNSYVSCREISSFDLNASTINSVARGEAVGSAAHSPSSRGKTAANSMLSSTLK